MNCAISLLKVCRSNVLWLHVEQLIKLERQQNICSKGHSRLIDQPYRGCVKQSQGKESINRHIVASSRLVLTLNDIARKNREQSAFSCDRLQHRLRQGRRGVASEACNGWGGNLNRACLVGKIPAANRLGAVDLRPRLEPQVRKGRVHSTQRTFLRCRSGLCGRR